MALIEEFSENPDPQEFVARSHWLQIKLPGALRARRLPFASSHVYDDVGVNTSDVLALPIPEALAVGKATYLLVGRSRCWPARDAAWPAWRWRFTPFAPFRPTSTQLTLDDRRSPEAGVI